MVDGQIPLGVALALAAAACFETGYVLQALEARRSPARAALRWALFAYLVRRRLWVAGIGLSLIGWPLQILALDHAPLSLVQPTLAVGLLGLLALGSRVLGERVGTREVVAALVIIASLSVVVWAAPPELGEVTRGPGLVTAVAVLIAATIAPFAFNALRGAAPIAFLVGAVGAADGLAAFVAKLVAEDSSAGAWGAAAAWVGLVGAVVALGLLSETSALQRAPATRVAPVVLCMQIAIPVLLAPLIGGEDWGQTPLGGVVLAAALAAAVAAVAVLAASPAVAGVVAGGAGAGGEGSGGAGADPTVSGRGSPPVPD